MFLNKRFIGILSAFYRHFITFQEWLICQKNGYNRKLGCFAHYCPRLTDKNQHKERQRV